MTGDPFARDNVGIVGRADEILCVIGEKSTVLIGHSSEPVRIFEGTANRLGDRLGEDRGGDSRSG